MGFIRGGLLVVVAVLLFITLLLGNIFFVMWLSLDYKNVQEEISPLVHNLINDSVDKAFGVFEEFGLLDFDLGKEIDDAFVIMQEHCEEYDDYVLVFEGHTIVLNCFSLEEGKDVFIEDSVNGFIENIYYKDYDCGFWDCFKKTGLPFFLISEKAKNYFQERFYFFLMVFLILAVLVFLLVEQKQNTPIIIGGFLALSALPLLKLENIAESIVGRIFSPFIGVFFSKANTVFWISFILGVSLFLAGIGLRLWQSDKIKKKFSKEDIKKMVKLEIDKKKDSNGKGSEKTNDKKAKKNLILKKLNQINLKTKNQMKRL